MFIYLLTFEIATLYISLIIVPTLRSFELYCPFKFAILVLSLFLYRDVRAVCNCTQLPGDVSVGWLLAQENYNLPGGTQLS